MKGMVLFVMFVALCLGFVKWGVPLVYIVWMVFLGVPLLAIAKIARTDLSEYSSSAWRPKKIKKG